MRPEGTLKYLRRARDAAKAIAGWKGFTFERAVFLRCRAVWGGQVDDASVRTPRVNGGRRKKLDNLQPRGQKPQRRVRPEGTPKYLRHAEGTLKYLRRARDVERFYF